MKVKNKIIYSDDQEFLKRVADELQFLGRPYRLNLAKGEVVQFARVKKRSKAPKSPKKERNKRVESFERS